MKYRQIPRIEKNFQVFVKFSNGKVRKTLRFPLVVPRVRIIRRIMNTVNAATQSHIHTQNIIRSTTDSYSTFLPPSPFSVPFHFHFIPICFFIVFILCHRFRFSFLIYVSHLRLWMPRRACGMLFMSRFCMSNQHNWTTKYFLRGEVSTRALSHTHSTTTTTTTSIA